MKHVMHALIVIAALPLLAATCVTNVAQHDDAGPWTGEVVNAGDQTVSNVAATARLLDGAGREVYPGRIGAIACPSKLLPRERGAFELFNADASYPPLNMPLADATLPLRAEFDSLAQEQIGTAQARGDGLLVTLLSRGEHVARVRLTNNGAGNYMQFTVCGILRAADDHHIIAVGRGDGPPLPYVLSPGTSIDMDVQFDAMAAGDLRFYALGLLDAPYAECCPLGASTWRSVNTGPFSVLLPPGWAYQPFQGIDSFVGSFAGDGIALNFDYGAYGGGAPLPDDSGYEIHDETIGGLAATFVLPKPGLPGTVFLTVANPDARSPLGQPVSLIMTNHSLSPEQQQIAVQIFRSLRFRP